MSCSPNTLLSDGKDFQRLSEREQLLSIAQLLCDITQAGGPFAVVLANGSVYGPNGVVDTTGTMTSGIQEAISSLPAGDLTSRFAGGGTIFFSKGVFICSGQITIPTAGAFDLRLEGVGKAGTILRYTGTASSFIKTSTDTVSGPPGSASLQFSARGIGFTATQDTSQIILLRLFSLNEADIDDCLFCPDAALASGGNCLNYTPGPAGHATGLEGLRTYGDNMARVRNCAFWGLARGFTCLSAHGLVENTYFDSRDADSNYSFSTDGTNFFPKSYMVMCSATDLLVSRCHFAPAGGIGYPMYADGGFIQCMNPTFEGALRTTLVGTANGGSIMVFAPNPNMDGSYNPSDYQMDNAGTITAGSVGLTTHMVAPNTNSGAAGDAVWTYIRSAVIEWMTPRIARITGSNATTTGQTLVDITGLSVPVDSSSTYEFEAVMSVATTAVTTGCKYAVQFSAVGASVEAQIIASSTATATESERISAFNTATSTFLTTSGETGQVLIKGILVTTSNGGNLTIQHLKVTSGTSTVNINSFLKVRRIA